MLPRPRVPCLTAQPLSVVFATLQLTEPSLLCPFPNYMFFFLHDVPLCLLNKLSQIFPQGDATQALAIQSAVPGASSSSLTQRLVRKANSQASLQTQWTKIRIVTDSQAMCELLKAYRLQDDATYRLPLSSVVDFSHY